MKLPNIDQFFTIILQKKQRRRVIESVVEQKLPIKAFVERCF